jgi:hypothetical protein
MTEYFHDPIQPSAIKRLFDRIKTMSDWTWIALVDTAFDHEKGGFPLFGPTRVNCYRSIISLESLQAAAPCLIALEADKWAEQAQALIAHRGTRPMLSFLAVVQGVASNDLVEQWRALHWASSPDGDKYLLRFADTRSLACLPEILSPEQWRAWCRGVAEWQYFDREGELAALTSPEASERVARNTRLDSEQFARLTEQALPDTVLDFIDSQEPGHIPANMPRSRVYRLTEKTLKKMRQAGIDHNDIWGADGAVLTVFTLKTDGKLLEAPELEGFLHAGQWESGHIREALEKEGWFGPYHGG